VNLYALGDGATSTLALLARVAATATISDGQVFAGLARIGELARATGLTATRAPLIVVAAAGVTAGQRALRVG